MANDELELNAATTATPSAAPGQSTPILTPEGWPLSTYPSGKIRFLSPSSLGLFTNCEYSFWLKYIIGWKEYPNEAMARGTLVHTICERLYKDNTVKTITDVLKLKLWAKNTFEQLWLKEKLLRNNEELKAETWEIVGRFIDGVIFEYKLLQKKYKDKPWMNVWKMISPQLETTIKNADYGVMGIIDKIVELDEEHIVNQKTTILTDYKTSTIYKIGFTEEYKDQLMFYGWLYQLVNGKLPDYASIHWLLYGLQTFHEVTQENVDKIKARVKELHRKINEDKDDVTKWAPNTEYKFCKNCPLGKAQVDKTGKIIVEAPCLTGFKKWSKTDKPHTRTESLIAPKNKH